MMVFLLPFFFFFSQPIFSLDVPPLQSRITDLANLLNSNDQEEIRTKLQAIESNTGAQIAVLIIPSLEGDSLESFSIRVVDEWKLGDKDKDDGALLLISLRERKLRWEVGYGLEGDLTDIFCFQNIKYILKPAFKEKRYKDGILASLEEVHAKLAGAGYVSDPNLHYKKKNQNELGISNLQLFGILFLLILSFVLSTFMGTVGGILSAAVIGSGFQFFIQLISLGILGSLFYAIKSFFIILAIMIALRVFIFARFFGGFGGGGSSGDLFRGGGGGFGGGGSSGDW
jgi:uncharacterized protein